MPRLSVIVPVYKVEKYIHKCVDSILNQTFSDFELILVDDGSPDNCGRICDEYAAKDSRVRVIHKKNGGLSDARNHGIDAAQGKVLGFTKKGKEPSMKDRLEDLKSIPKEFFWITNIESLRCHKEGRYYVSELVDVINKFVEGYEDNEEYKQYCLGSTTSSPMVRGRLDYWRKIIRTM